MLFHGLQSFILEMALSIFFSHLKEKLGYDDVRFEVNTK